MLNIKQERGSIHVPGPFKIFSYLFKPPVMFCTFSSINPYLNAKIALIPGNFEKIPVSRVRVPGIVAEIDPPVLPGNLCGSKLRGK